ncbi:MAG: hypothetical protein KDC98_10825 [Planctomycetes bacterium]|nr:hypothetical protein [Planctomycetota bacterium]
MPTPSTLSCLVPMLLLATLCHAQCATTWQVGDPVPGINLPVSTSIPWDPDGAGPRPTMLVAGGGFSAAGDQLVNGIAVYDPTNGTWGTLGEGFTNDSAVYALAVLANGDLIAGGYLVASGSTSLAGIARWNGQQWVSLGSGVYGAVYALAVLPNGTSSQRGRSRLPAA